MTALVKEEEGEDKLMKRARFVPWLLLVAATNCGAEVGADPPSVTRVRIEARQAWQYPLSWQTNSLSLTWS